MLLHKYHKAAEGKSFASCRQTTEAVAISEIVALNQGKGNGLLKI